MVSYFKLSTLNQLNLFIGRNALQEVPAAPDSWTCNTLRMVEMMAKRIREMVLKRFIKADVQSISFFRLGCNNYLFCRKRY